MTDSPSPESEFRASDSNFVEVVQSHLGGRAVINFPVAELTTYKVGGRASFFFVAQSFADLEAITELYSRTKIPVVVIGRGSNLLFADTGFAGLVVQLGNFASELEIPPVIAEKMGTKIAVRLGGGVLLPVAARQLAAVGLRGFEWAVGVPGTIGGGVRMNAGGHGSDMSESLRTIEVFHVSSGQRSLFPVGDIGLRFRGSALTDLDIVLSATLILECGSSAEAMAEIDDIVKWRRTNQPGGQNAGSVFVNPVPHQVSAGELIDQCGRRGFRVGSAHVSVKHANFIQSDPKGTASDVIAVMREVRAVVFRDTGHVLRSEVRLLGFPDEVTTELSSTTFGSLDTGNPQ